jgi:lysophospholipase L1-like esterase
MVKPKPRTVPSRKFDWRIAVAAGVVAMAALWLLWPSSLSKVRNLGSRGTTIIAFGDSLTAGYGATRGDDYPSKLSTMIGSSVINAGVSGDTTDAALARIDRDVLGENPKVVIVGLGGNDFLRGVPIATTEANLRTIIRRIQSAGAMVVLLGFRFPSLQVDYEEMYERVAEDEGALLVPDMLDGILSNPSLKSDEIHPNGAGYALMAERVAEPFSKLMKKAGATP